MDLKTHLCQICEREVAIPADLLAGLAEAPGLIAEAVRSAGEVAYDGWSPGEVAAHLADTETGFGWRLRMILSYDEPELQAFDQELWADALQYKRRDVETSLQAFAAQRAANVDILRRLGAEAWERTYRHPEYGTLTLRAPMEHKADHDLGHLRQIRGE